MGDTDREYSVRFKYHWHTDRVLEGSSPTSTKDELWPVEEERNTNYILTPTERKYIKSGSTGSYSGRQLENRIRKKRDRLPQRFQHLIDDIALLQYGDYISDSNWSEIEQDNENNPDSWHDFWRSLTRINSRFKKITDKPVNRILSPRRDQQTFQYGFEIGSILKSLSPYTTESSSIVDLIHGIIIAFVGEPRSQLGFESGKFDLLLRDLEHAEEQRVDWVRKPMHDPEEAHKYMVEFNTVYENVCQEKDIPANLILKSAIHQQLPRHLSEIDSIEDSIKERIDILMEVTPLDQMEDIRSQMGSDKASLKKSRPGIESGRQLLDAIWSFQQQDLSAENTDPNQPLQNENRTKPTSKKIAKYINNPGADNQVTTVLLRLSTDPDSDLWTQHPLVKPTEQNRGTVKVWRLTNYGKLLCYSLFERKNLEWVYRYALMPDQIELTERKLIIDALYELDYFEAL